MESVAYEYEQSYTQAKYHAAAGKMLSNENTK